MLTNFNSLPTEGFVRLNQVLKVFPISKTSWYEGVKAGVYPAPIKLSERCSAYKVEDIRKLISTTGDTPVF